MLEAVVVVPLLLLLPLNASWKAIIIKDYLYSRWMLQMNLLPNGSNCV